jgi:hypothetical protein
VIPRYSLAEMAEGLALVLALVVLVAALLMRLGWSYDPASTTACLVAAVTAWGCRFIAGRFRR